MLLKVHSHKPGAWEGQGVVSENGGERKTVLVIDGRPISPEQAEQADYEVSDATAEELSKLREAGYHLRGTFSAKEMNDAKQAIRVIVRWQKATEFTPEDFASRLKVPVALAHAAADELAANGELEHTQGRYRLKSYGMI